MHQIYSFSFIKPNAEVRKIIGSMSSAGLAHVEYATDAYAPGILVQNGT
jgi:hypothetical protein